MRVYPLISFFLIFVIQFRVSSQFSEFFEEMVYMP